MGIEQRIAVRADVPSQPAASAERQEAMVWLASVLTRYAEAEQAIGRLSLAIDLPIRNGSLDNLELIRSRLEAQHSRACRLLATRIGRWSANRPFRHLLAHATLRVLRDEENRKFVATRHLPRDANDVTPDRVWSDDERRALLLEITKDGRSICDLIRNLLTNPTLLSTLKS